MYKNMVQKYSYPHCLLQQKHWEQGKFPLAGENINASWYIYKMEYYIIVKMNHNDKQFNE